MKKNNMLKKLSFVMACCVALNTPGIANAAATNTKTGSMTTVSGIKVSIRVSAQQTVLTQNSTSSVKANHKQVINCPLVLIGPGGRTKTMTAKYTCKGYDTLIGSSVKVSAFSSSDYIGFYYKGYYTVKFTSIKIPEAKEVGKTLQVKVPQEIV